MITFEIIDGVPSCVLPTNTFEQNMKIQKQIINLCTNTAKKCHVDPSEIFSYLCTDDWKKACEHGAMLIQNDLEICFDDWKSSN